MSSVTLSLSLLTHTFKKKKKSHSDKVTVIRGSHSAVTFAVTLTEREVTR